jgi:hypothetical protein
MVTVLSFQDTSTTSTNLSLQAALTVLNANFAEVLNNLLVERGCLKGELYDYIFMRGCQIDQGTMYRYFNANGRTNRFPTGEKGQQFLALFCDFLELSEVERAALIFIWQVQRRQQRKNGSGQIRLSDQGICY